MRRDLGRAAGLVAARLVAARLATAGLATVGLGLAAAPAAEAGDWPQWGRTPARNMTAPDEKGLPAAIEGGTPVEGVDRLDLSTAKHLKWVAKLGSQSYGNVSVRDGRVCLGTNNGTPRDPRVQGDYSHVMCFEEATGAFQWQMPSPKLGAGKVSDWEYLGICSAPALVGDEAYYVSNRGEVVAVDLDGLTDGNDGAFKGEAAYVGGPKKPPLALGPLEGETLGDILWTYDMREELAVFPHNITSSSVLQLGDKLYVTTSNGVDWSHKNIPSPFAPSLIVLDRRTGQLLGEEASGIGERLMHANWSSPAFALVPVPGPKKRPLPTRRKGKRSTKRKAALEPVVLFGAGDGFLYGFEPEPTLDEDGIPVLAERWRLDANPPSYRVKDGVKRPYARKDGPSEIIATPVFADGLVYVAVGQDPEHGPGIGALSAVNPSGRGDITQTGLVWRFEGIGRSISTVAVEGGIVYAADLAGVVYALDATRGTLHWKHDTKSRIWASPMVADGKLYIGNEDGVLTVLGASKTLEVLHRAQLDAPVYASAVAANGVVYVASQTRLYAFAKDAPTPKAELGPVAPMPKAPTPETEDPATKPAPAPAAPKPAGPAAEPTK